MANNITMSIMFFTTVAICAMISPIEIQGFVNSCDMVRNSSLAISGDSIIVAVVADPIYLKSERELFMANLAKNVAQEYGFSRVIVSLDSDIYVKLLSAKGEDEVKKLQQLAIKRGGSYEYNGDNRA